MASRFKQALDSGKFVITSEVAPPKGTNLEKMFHHIVTPQTGHSPRLATSVTVKALSVMDADALATGIMVMPPREGVRFVDSQPGCECFVVGQDGSFRKSAHWNRLV